MVQKLDQQQASESFSRKRDLELMQIFAKKNIEFCLLTYKALDKSKTISDEIDDSTKCRRHIQLFTLLSKYCEILQEHSELDMAIIESIEKLTCAYYSNRAEFAPGRRAAENCTPNISVAEQERYRIELLKHIYSKPVVTEHLKSDLLEKLITLHEEFLRILLFIGQMEKDSAGQKCCDLLTDVLKESRKLVIGLLPAV